MIEPITPEEVENYKIPVPEEVIESFNELIVENWSQGASHISKNELIHRILSKREGKIIERWFDVKDIFGEAGWDVEFVFEKFIFKKKK